MSKQVEQQIERHVRAALTLVHDSTLPYKAELEVRLFGAWHLVKQQVERKGQA